MMLKNITLVGFVLTTFAGAFAQDSVAIKRFREQQKTISQSFNNYFNRNTSTLYGGSEGVFVRKIDSLRRTFLDPVDSLRKANPAVGDAFFDEQYTDINYTFDRFILDYVPVHKRITGQQVVLSQATAGYLDRVVITNPTLLRVDSFRDYLKSLLLQQTDLELKTNPKVYAASSNRRLDAGLTVARRLFSDNSIRDMMSFMLLIDHIENFGVKDIARQVEAFQKMSADPKLDFLIQSAYGTDMEQRKEHVIETYKKAGIYTLDAHIFKPIKDGKQHPAIVFFHGGGWSEGKPDWFFSTCQSYQERGWVAVAIEYRLRDRHGTLPPEAMADGKSAIRYLRRHAKRLGVDPERIVAAGNSAGASLALTLAVIDTLDEKSEDLRISSVPNAIMINSGAADLSQGDFWQQYYTDKAFLKHISPLHRVRPKLPPMLIIHGTRDYNVPLEPMQNFAQQMAAAGNDCEFHVLEGAGHFLWYDPRFSDKVAEYRKAFLKRLNYP